MCNACGNYCCDSGEAFGCGCDDCIEACCWSELLDREIVMRYRGLSVVSGTWERYAKDEDIIAQI